MAKYRVEVTANKLCGVFTDIVVEADSKKEAEQKALQIADANYDECAWEVWDGSTEFDHFEVNNIKEEKK